MWWDRALDDLQAPLARGSLDLMIFQDLFPPGLLRQQLSLEQRVTELEVSENNAVVPFK